jgi:GTP pyrophosphokinase
MNVVKPLQMDEQGMLQLKGIYLAPYIQLATALIGKSRHAGGNMFRHQIDTMGILIDYGYLDGILLKASLIHDLIEDIPGYDVQNILNIDKDSPEVLKLVMEVTKKEGQTKKDFLLDIMKNGSENAKILKCADRISNMISLGFVTDEKFIARYCDETEFFVFPIALDVDYNMYQELINLVMTRRRYLEDTDYYLRYKE